MMHHDASARRRCCAEAQARGVRGGGSPPGKNATAAKAREQAPTSPFDGETPSMLPRGHLPPRVLVRGAGGAVPPGGAGGGAPPPGKRETRTRGNKCQLLMGKHLRSRRADIYPPAFFFPGPVHPIPPGEAGRGRRGDNTMMLPKGPVQSLRPGSFN